MKNTFFLVFFMIGFALLLTAQEAKNYNQQLNKINDSIQVLDSIPRKFRSTYIKMLELERQKSAINKAIEKTNTNRFNQLIDSLNLSVFNTKEDVKNIKNSYIQQKFKTSILQMLLILSFPIALFFIYLYFNLKHKIKKQTEEEQEIRKKEKEALLLIDQMKEELENYKSSFSEFSNSIDSLKQKNTALHDEIENIKEENTTLKENFQTANQALETAKTQLTEEHEKRNEMVEALQKLIANK